MRLRFRLPGLRGAASSLLEIMRTFRGSLAGQRGKMAMAVLLSLLIAGLELSRPWPLKIIIDSVLLPRLAGKEATWAGLSATWAIIAAAAWILVVSILIGWATVQLTVVSAQVGRKIATRIRRRVFEHLHSLALPFHEEARTGDLLVRLMGDVNMVRDVLFTAWMTVLGRGAVLLGTAIILFFIDPVVALIALAPLPVLFFSIQRSTRRLKKVAEKQRKKEGAVASYAAESLSRIAVIKAFAAEERSTNEFSKMVRGSEKAELESKRISAGMGRKAEALTGFGLATVLCTAAHRALRGFLLPGDLIVALSYTRALYKPLRKISTDGARLGKAAACAQRLIEILKLPPEEDEGGEEAPRFSGAIRLENVHLAYPNGRKALQGVSLSVPAGGLVHVLGKNGAGKSTLLAVLLRLRRPDKGSVLVDGRDVGEFGMSSYRDRIAFVPQRLQLFSGTVKENILYGRPSATDEEVLAAARAALCDEFVNDLPDGYETVLGEGGTRLSGGESRRIMLARAAVRDARILLLDEPLAGLDPAACATVGHALSSIAEGRTTIVVHHGDGTEISADLVVRMESGRASTLAGPKAGTTATTRARA